MNAEAQFLSPWVPAKDPRDLELVNTSVTIPKWIRDRVGELAEEKGYSRAELLTLLLKFALAHMEAAESKGGVALFEALVSAQEATTAALAAYEREKKGGRK